MMLLDEPTITCAQCMHLPKIHIPKSHYSHRHQHSSWVVDSGASVHCVSDPSMLTSVYYKHPPVMIKVADNRTLHAHAVGTAILPLLDDHNRTHYITVHNVIYHPNFYTNLISVRRLWKDNRIMCLFDPHNYMKDTSTGMKYPISFDRQYISSHPNNILSTSIIDNDIIHARFAHASARRLDKLATRSIGFPKPSHIRTRIDPASCDACNAGAARRLPFSKHANFTKYTYFGACLSSDLCGPFPRSLDGYLYILM